MALDFEHFIGLNPIKGGALFHPNGQHYLSAAGGNVVISDLMDSNKQEFLRGHDDNITALTVSKNGTFVASGQGGTDSNVIVWDFETRKILYTIEEHDYAIQSLAFSDDEKILATLGSSEDHKMVLWDMSTGAIIAFTNKVPSGSLCCSFGGHVRDIKRRDTNNYLLCSGGKEGLMMWDLDPYQGELMPFRLAGDARATMVRIVTDVCFSIDKEYVYASTTTGDFLIASMKHNRIIQTVQATKLGLDAIVAAPVGIIVGCGDKTVKVFDNTFEFQGEIVFDGIVDGLSMSPDSMEILVTTRHGSVYRANVASRDHIIISEAHTAGITAVAYEMGSNDHFATASLDGTIKLWDNQDYVVSATCHPRRDQERGVIPLCVAYSDIIISGWSDGKVCAYDDLGTLNLLLLSVDLHCAASSIYPIQT
jgi:cilia- and flagella-associated protein 52